MRVPFKQLIFTTGQDLKAPPPFQACFVNCLGLVFTLPYAVYMEVADKNGILQCSESWWGTPRTIYGAFVNVTQFVLPFTTIFVCYT